MTPLPKSLALALLLASSSFAANQQQKELAATVAKAWPPDAVYRISFEGIMAEPESNPMVYNMFQGGKVTNSMYRGLNYLSSASASRSPLKLGERVQVTKVNVDNFEVQLSLLSVDKHGFISGLGAKRSQENVRCVLALRPVAHEPLTADDVTRILHTVLGPDQEPTVSLGQTPAEVKAILGAPSKILDLKTKQTWVYKDVKVIFVNGKISDLQ